MMNILLITKVRSFCLTNLCNEVMRMLINYKLRNVELTEAIQE